MLVDPRMEPRKAIHETLGEVDLSELTLHKLLAVGAAFVAGAYITSAQSGPSDSVREVKITAEKFQFSPSVIKVKRGDHVRLTVTALDSEHGFKLDGFHIERKVPKGQAVTMDFTADQAGDFSFQCSH